MPRLTEAEVIGAMGRVEQALGDLDGLPPITGAAMRRVAEALVDLYGEGLARIVERLQADAPAVLQELLDDRLVAHLLLVHDLHPSADADGVAIDPSVLAAPADPAAAGANADGGPAEAFIPLAAVGARRS